MRLLLDTHAAVWSLVSTHELSARARAAIETPETEVLVSVASVWEVAIKVGLGKWPEAKPLLDNFESELAIAKFRLLPISVPHARMAGQMQSPHRDPFDRLLAAQAINEGLALVSSDMRLAGLGAQLIW